MFSLKYRKNYFLLNLIFRIIQKGTVDLVTPQWATRGSRAPVMKTYIAFNDSKGRSPVYYARDLWNKLKVETRNIQSLAHFKTVLHKDMNDAYAAEEIARFTAGLYL